MLRANENYALQDNSCRAPRNAPATLSIRLHMYLTDHMFLIDVVPLEHTRQIIITLPYTEM